MLKIPARFKQCDLSVTLAFDYCDCIVNMGTRAAAFTAKIRSLYDYHLRLMQGVMPPPSGVDIANTVKYFSQTLLSVLKDVTHSPLELLKRPDMDNFRLSLFPSLDYKGLYNSLIPLLEAAPLIQYGIHAFGQAVLQCLGCLLPFLESDLIDNLPHLAASAMVFLPPSVHQDIINSLCFYILPFTIARHNNSYHLEPSEVSLSVSAVIMMVFQYSSNPAHHCQLLECLMTLKQNVLKDVLNVIAYGTSTARSPAAKLLFYYWPTFNANLLDRKNLIGKIAGDPSPFVCQRDMCPNAGNAEAAKVCFDHCIAITFASDTPPPLYLCIECANEIHREHPNQMFFDILHPMQQVSMVCENKNCRSTDKSAISICFSTECASYNGNHPIRYCEQCHNNRHNTKRGGDHIVHFCVPPTWDMDSEMQTYMVEAIISLLKDSKVELVDNKENTEGKNTIPTIDNITIEERQLLGRYGVWLLVGRCTPKENTPTEILGRLLSMLFHWFHMTAYSYDGNVQNAPLCQLFIMYLLCIGKEESTLEKLKTENVCTWLREITNTHNDVFVSCLLPHPPDYARVGGHWDTLSSRTSHLKEGLNRLFCLVPYEVINQDIWDYVMPFWMEAIVNDVPEKELLELRVILSKILDTEMSPLGFDEKKMYHFVAERFKKNSSKVQEQALHWLQTLTLLEIVIPLNLLFTIFEDGVLHMKQGTNRSDELLTQFQETGFVDEILKEKITPPVAEEDSAKTSISSQNEFENDAEHNLSCCIIMLDILLKQMELQNIDKHTGLNSTLCKDVCWLLKCMITTAWIGTHTCNSKTECTHCESCVMWHQLSLQLVKYLSPIYPARPPDPPLEETLEDPSNRKSPPESDKKEKSEVVLNMPMPEIHSIGGVLVHMPHVCSIMTATVETVSEQLDLAAIIPAEKVVSAVARAITLSETDVATATVQVAKPQVIGENDEPIEQDSNDDFDNFWQTSVGKFKFNFDDLPQPLQYIHQLLQELSKVDQPEIMYYMLQCLNILILHGDACTKASKEHRGFFIWCQENSLIKNLWELCSSEYSHICQEVVPLLLHCITLPAGSDVFWRLIEEDFHSSDWCVRFIAVERVTVIARFMDSTPLRNILPLQAALANAFCYLISSMDDNNIYVAQRATLYLGTIHDSAITSLIMCLETQFDTVIIDRPMVLQSLYQLHNSISERKILTWEFFLNRFDTLFLEAQVNLEKSGDISYLRDLRNSDINSEAFIRKLHRAHEALSQSDGSAASSVKTLSASFGTKWPYKRTMSAPASIITRQENKVVSEMKEKIYNRQYSAPILKRKSSRFGLDGHMHSLNIVDDQNILVFLQRVIDFEEADRETMHLLVFLLMQFLSRSDQAYPTEEKYLSKIQGIVLRHLYLLLGYSQNDRGIYVSPQRLRNSPAFTVFISNLPQVLDQNHMMGRLLIPTCLILLQYAPSPYYIPNTMEFQQPSYSLWALDSHFRKHWLMSLVVMLYKYQYTQQPHCIQLISLIRIVLNTLDSQHHHCRRIAATIIMGAPPARSRDVSQPSLGTENDHVERITPPLSPMYSSDGQSVQVSLGSKGSKTQVIYAKPSSTTSMETHWEEAIHCLRIDKKSEKKITEIIDDDTESELITIPESDQSDSTLQGSVQDSFDDVQEDSIGEKSPKLHTTVRIQDQLEYRYPKENMFNSLPKSSCKRPTWIIGEDSDSPKSITMKNGKKEDDTDSSKESNSCNKVVSKHVQLNNNHRTTEFHRQSSNSSDSNKHTRPTPLGKHKKVIEPSITPVCTPVSDCEDCFKNNQESLKTPSLERLLPIGSSRISEKIYTQTLEAQLEIPSQERLLPIGQHTKDISQLVEKVRQALDLNPILPQKIDNKLDSTSKKQSALDHGFISHSPRRLIKQVALESPPNQMDHEDLNRLYKSNRLDQQRENLSNQRQRIRKAGPFTMGSYTLCNPRKPGSWLSPQLSPGLEVQDLKRSSSRIGEESVNERCPECGAVREEYSDDEIGLCIIILGTFIHREPALAAPLLPDMLSIVGRVATNPLYPWQSETNIHLPGGAISVAHQFLRCVLHQLAPNGIFIQMFQTKASEKLRIQFFKSVIQALIDFNELNPIAPLQLLLEMMNSKKTIPVDTLPTILQNISFYLNCLPLEAGLGPSTPMWNSVFQQIETLFRRILLILNILDDASSLLKIMVSLFRIPPITQYRGILEPFSKILSYAIQNHQLKYSCLAEICYLCNRAFTKERDKLILSRMVVFELVQALKFKTTIPDSNLLMLINLILQDIGGSIPTNVAMKDWKNYGLDYTPSCTTGISECMKLHLTEILDFLTDFHTISKMKSYCKGINVGLNDDTIGGIIKCSVAQYLALEITKGNGRDNRAVSKYLPWLYTASTPQQSPREFVECIGHIRLLSWILLGSLTHSALQGARITLSQPIPQEASCQIADHIQVILVAFAEQPKASILHMSSLFHTFILCQLWTIYLEQGLTNHLPSTEAYTVTMNILFDFWAKVTPCILQLVQHSKMLSEIVSLHFLSMIEALLECQSTFVGKLLPLWTPVLCSNQIQLPGHLQVRLQYCRNFPPSTQFESNNHPDKAKMNLNNVLLLKWLQRLQFKMGQIELQSSTATHFYSL
ncbi:protein unc-79 homolog isoform X1 [Harmonia axyridis]|uniref:protein unc-79 homolog isoform X1 n=1 Tax=Harmonia axyridis TaxID=115357 RepID=UPI001E278BAE|nr:protein unc-79 homolog isoform X1 [Harmonia axyridis]